MPEIKINDDEIKYVETVCDLGFNINRIGNGEEHIDTIIRKSYGCLSTLRPLKKLLPSEIRLQLMKTMLLPIVDYMDVINHAYGVHETNNSSNRLEIIRNNCIRFILYSKWNDHITAHRESLKLPKMYDRREFLVASIIKQIIN